MEGVGQIALPEPIPAADIRAVGQDDAFSSLLRRQSRFVFQVAYAVLRNTHDAEDIVQDTFLKIYRTKAWQRMDDERAFLARTAWRLAVERRPRGSRNDKLDFDTPDRSASAEDSLISADWNAIVHKLVDALPEELRQPLALSTVRDLTSREIAEWMGIPEGTVRTRLMRARTMLKEKLSAWKEVRRGH